MLDPYVIIPMLFILMLAVFASYCMIALLVYVKMKDGLVPSALWLIYPIFTWLKARKASAPVNPITLLYNELADVKAMLKENLALMKQMVQGKGPVDGEATTTSTTTTLPPISDPAKAFAR